MEESTEREIRHKTLIAELADALEILEKEGNLSEAAIQ
jgi:hypothetical protein